LVSEDERISIIKEEFRDSSSKSSVNHELTNNTDNSPSSGNDDNTSGKK
jgi:hypothetical protein